MISRRILAAVALLCLIAAPAQAQKTKSALINEINTAWPDNTSSQITPALLRSTVIDIVNSYYDLAGGTSLACAAHLWVSGLPTLSSLTCTQPTFPDIAGQTTLAQLPTIGAGTALCSIVGGAPVACTPTQLTTLINTFATSFSGSVPSPGAVSGRFLGDDGTWHTATGSGTLTSVICNGLTITGAGTCPEAFGFANCTLAASVASNALTIALKDNNGNDPSATSPCRISFRNSTLATGTPVLDSVTAALSVTVPSGQVLGTSNNVPFRFWVEAVDNSGTVVLAVFNASAAGTIFPIPEANLNSTTTIAAAPSAGVFYSASALSSKAVATLGYVEYSSGLATAGTYASGPTEIQTYRAGIKKPGEVVQIGPTGTLTTQATITMGSTPAYTTTGLSTTITPTSKVNYVSCQVSGVGGVVTASDVGYFQIIRGGVNVGLGHQMFGAASNFFIDLNLSGIDAPGSTGMLTYTLFTQIATASHSIIFPASSGVISNIGGSIGCSELQG